MWTCPACTSLCHCAACTRSKHQQQQQQLVRSTSVLGAQSAFPRPLSPLPWYVPALHVTTTASPSSSDSSSPFSLSSAVDSPDSFAFLAPSSSAFKRPAPLRIPSPSLSSAGMRDWREVEDGEVGAQEVYERVVAPFVPLCIARESSEPFFSFPAAPHCAVRNA